MNRRLLCLVIAWAAVPAVGDPTTSPSSEANPDFSWLNQKDGPRPKYVWESREDVIYHEMWYPDPDKTSAPEIWAIVQCPWVFNRAMRWVETDNGTVVAYCEGGDLPLTGKHQVSRWYSDPRNELTDEGDTTRFVKKNTVRRRDCAVLPAFQFHLGQHPLLQLTVREASDPWQFVASIKGRSGAPFLCSGWQESSKTMTFDIATKLRELGYTNNYAELHFVIGTWAEDARSPSSVSFEAELVSQACVVACLPVIRARPVEMSPARNAVDGLPIAAVVLNKLGHHLTAEQAEVIATINGQRVNLKEQAGVWAGRLSGLPVGNHEVTLSAGNVGLPVGPASSRSDRQDAGPTMARQIVRVTDGEYCRYDPAVNAIRDHEKINKPMTGSFQGTFFYADAGMASERLVKTQADWNNWDRSEPPGEHLHYWESLTEPELDERFRYLAGNGWDLLHLHTHFGMWERFDAFGYPAPHGVEQFAAYVRSAHKYGLHVMLALSSYPYSEPTTGRLDRTMPYAQTLEAIKDGGAGFKNEDWTDPTREPFGSQYRRYLKSFVGLFRDETGVFSWSSSGEGDWINGIKRFQDSRSTVRSIDPHHIFVSEPIHMLKKLPANQAAGFAGPIPPGSEMIGDRDYSLGSSMPYEQEVGLLFRFNRMVPNMYLAEGDFPSSTLYTKMTSTGTPYVGRPEYRIHVRDTLYLGLVHRMPILMTWDEVFTEDEHRVIADVKRGTTTISGFDWTQPMEEPAVAILVSDADASEEGRKHLAQYEETFTHLPLDYRFIASRDEARAEEIVIDPRQPFEAKMFVSPESLPQNLRARMPITVSRNYAASYCVNRDHNAMLAYLYNTADHTDQRFYLGARYHRRPKPTELHVSFLNISSGQTWRLYDLNDKRVDQEGVVNGHEIRINGTSHDYLLCVGPAGETLKR